MQHSMKTIHKGKTPTGSGSKFNSRTQPRWNYQCLGLQTQLKQLEANPLPLPTWPTHTVILLQGIMKLYVSHEEGH